MKHTILLRLSGPMQSWGNVSKFESRRTWSYPSKSGVIGLVAACLGMSREDDLSELCAMRFGVRADYPGKIERDFQILLGSKPSKNVLSERFYIADATFLAGLESENKDDLLEIETALKNPYYTPYLGRLSYPVTLPLFIGIRDKDLETVLTEEPLLTVNKKNGLKKGGKIKMLIETTAGEQKDGILNDVPVTFSHKHRMYALRGYRMTYIDHKEEMNEHDVMGEL